MKTLLSILLLFTTVCSQAQVKVIWLNDTTSHAISRAALDKDYKSLQTLFKAQPALLGKYQREQAERVNTFLSKRSDLPKIGVGVTVSAYFEPDGTAKWVLLDPFGEPSDSLRRTVVRILTDFYAANPFILGSSVAFSVKTTYFIGQPALPKRSVRPGSGTLTTLEAARRTTRPDTVTVLFFNQLSLRAIPEEVYRFPNLEELDLSKNAIGYLPARLTADLPKLKRVSLLFNQLTDDSVSFSRNKHLVALNIQGNKLTRVPISARSNRRLESLWIGNNKLVSVKTNGLRRVNDLNLYNAGLSAFPRQITRLRRLKVLDLYYNSFTVLPRQLGRMRQLEQLALAHNKLNELPASLSGLRNLQTLFVHHNQLSQLPATMNRLTNLTVLDIGYNWFSVVPAVLPTMASLEELDMSNNNLQELPASLTQLTRLKKLYLRQNPLLRNQEQLGTAAKLIDQLEANRIEVFH
ncbi:MAG: leucine-rich repeat domain-containing protein [Bacteroidetes bacterium]|nr:leucine-rich repeat domain-containing protein [Fibrella sp.]